MTKPKPKGFLRKRRSDYIERPFCLCGCGQHVKKRGSKWCNGHQKERPGTGIKGPRNSRWIPRPLCLCGCGEHVRGPRQKWLNGHWMKVHYRQVCGKFKDFKGVDNPRWKGGRSRNKSNNYVSLHASLGEERIEHRQIARNALGRAPGSAIVFAARPGPGRHVTGNLVISSSHGYRALIQRRARAYDATGDPEKRWCYCCGTWDDLTALCLRVDRGCAGTHHKECACFKEHLRSSKLRPPARGPKWRMAALAWKQEVAERRRINAERRRDRPLRGKVSKSRLRKSDPPMSPIHTFQAMDYYATRREGS